MSRVWRTSMVIPWSMPWIDLHTDERFTRTLIEERWGLTEIEGEVACMAEDESEIGIPEVASHPILSGTGDSGSTMAVGEDPLMAQMRELTELLREAGYKCGDKTPYEASAQKRLFRMVEQGQRFIDEHS